MATVLAPASSDAISSSPAQSLPGLMAAIAEPLSSAATAPGKDEFRHAMARLGTAVNIVTTDGPGGRAGFTASAVCSVTDSPPTLLVCLNRSASVYAAFDVNGVLCVNVLGAGQQALSNLFGGKTAMGERFAAAQWHTQASGAPLLQGALVSFDCRIVNRTSVGTHDVLFCEVQAIALGDAARGLVYLDRRYYELGE